MVLSSHLIIPISHMMVPSSHYLVPLFTSQLIVSLSHLMLPSTNITYNGIFFFFDLTIAIYTTHTHTLFRESRGDSNLCQMGGNFPLHHQAKCLVGHIMVSNITLVGTLILSHLMLPTSYLIVSTSHLMVPISHMIVPYHLISTLIFFSFIKIYYIKRLYSTNLFNSTYPHISIKIFCPPPNYNKSYV